MGQVCRWPSASRTRLIPLKNPLFFGIPRSGRKALKKHGLWNAPEAILPAWVGRFGGVFECSFSISSVFQQNPGYGLTPSPSGCGALARLLGCPGISSNTKSSHCALCRTLGEVLGFSESLLHSATTCGIAAWYRLTARAASSARIWRLSTALGMLKTWRTLFHTGQQALFHFGVSYRSHFSRSGTAFVPIVSSAAACSTVYSPCNPITHSLSGLPP
jgi:hypothetical protein